MWYLPTGYTRKENTGILDDTANSLVHMVNTKKGSMLLLAIEDSTGDMDRTSGVLLRDMSASHIEVERVLGVNTG